MTVAGVSIVQRPGSLKIKGGLQNDHTREIGYDVLMASAAAADDDVLAYVNAQTGIALGGYWSYGGYSDAAFCADYTVDQDVENPAVFRTTFVFKTHPNEKPKENNSDPTNANPFLRPPEIAFGDEQHTLPMETAYKATGTPPVPGGNLVPVRNSAGGRFGRVPMYQEGYQTLVYTRCEPTFPLTIARQFKYVANFTTFLGDPAGTWLCKPISGRWVFEQIPAGTALPSWLGGGVTAGTVVGYYRVTYTLLYSQSGWITEIIDEGTEVICDDPGSPAYQKRVTPLDPKKVPIRGLVALDGNGRRLDETILNDPAQGPRYLYWSKRQRAGFSALNLDETLINSYVR